LLKFYRCLFFCFKAPNYQQYNQTVHQPTATATSMPAGQQGTYTAVPGSQGLYTQNFAGQGHAVAGNTGNVYQVPQGPQFSQHPQSTVGGMYAATTCPQPVWQSNAYRPDHASAPTNAYSQPGLAQYAQPGFGNTVSQPAVYNDSSYQQHGPSNVYPQAGNAGLPNNINGVSGFSQPVSYPTQATQPYGNGMPNYGSPSAYTVPAGAEWQNSATGTNQQAANGAPASSTASRAPQNAPVHAPQQNGNVQSMQPTTISNEPCIVKPPVLTRNTSG
jgi:hypothetical protein